MKQQIFNYLQNQEETALFLQKEMVGLPALSPENAGTGEQTKAEFIRTYLKQIGNFRIMDLPAEDCRIESGERPNIAAIINGRDQDRTIWIVSHMDIVPPGGSELWNTDPFTLYQDGDYIYGRGVEDNHQGIVSSILAAKSIIANSVVPSTNLGLLFVADEETGNKYGLEFVMNNHPELFGPNDCFLVPDIGNSDSTLLEVAEKNLAWIKLTIEGKQCHASTPNKGTNTLLVASDLVLRLRSLYNSFDKRNEMFKPPYSTFESTKKEANVPNVNTIPGRDTFYLDCRILPEYDLQEVFSEIDRILEDCSNYYNAKIEKEILHSESSPSTSPDNDFIKKLMDSIQDVYGVTASPQGVGGGTVAAYPRQKGFPAAVWSTLLGNAHQPNEHTSLINTIKDAQVFVNMLL